MNASVHSGATPFLTVLMSVYNGEQYLNEAIDSIRGQTFSDFEFLIIDDGSTDGSAEILARHAAADSRIRLIRQENRGLIASLNRGFAEARGEWVARMDADDISRPYRFEAQLAFLRAHPSIALLGGAIDVVDEDGTSKQIIRLPETPERIRIHMRELGCALAHPTVVVRRDAVLEARGFRSAYRHAEDYDLWLRLIEKHDSANLPETLLSYRRHAGAISSKHAIQQTLSSICARAAAKQRLAGKPDPTWDVDVITRDIVLSLGVDARWLDREMVRGLREAAEMAVDQGRWTAAIEFIEVARPYGKPGELLAISLELNRHAAKLAISPEDRAEHRRRLQEASPGVFSEVFGAAPSSNLDASLWDILQQCRYDTDKSQEYLNQYHCTFSHFRYEEIALLEIGINRGGSLYLWRDYFPKAKIVGLDLNPPLDFYDATGRCRAYQCDQGDAAALRRLAAAGSPTGFRIIIDDASHLGSLTASTFKTLFYDYLQPGGYYAIEDWGTGYWDMWPDGARPTRAIEPNFESEGTRFPSHDAGMVGFVKQLVDECALSDIFHPRFGITRTRKSWIRSMHISPGLLIIQKAV